MRALLHVCAIVLALPQVLLCALFLLIGHVTGGRTLGSLFVRVLETMYVLFSWGGLLAVLAFLLILGAGFHARARRVAAGIVALLVLASGVMLVAQGGGIDPLIFLPGLISLGVSVWLVASAERIPIAARTETV